MVQHLSGWENEVYLWVEQESSVMLRASTRGHNDPVELTAKDARTLAGMLLEAARQLEGPESE